MRIAEGGGDVPMQPLVQRHQGRVGARSGPQHQQIVVEVADAVEDDGQLGLSGEHFVQRVDDTARMVGEDGQREVRRIVELGHRGCDLEGTCLVPELQDRRGRIVQALDADGIGHRLLPAFRRQEAQLTPGLDGWSSFFGRLWFVVESLIWAGATSRPEIHLAFARECKRPSRYGMHISAVMKPQDGGTKRGRQARFRERDIGVALRSA
jgi:hypothetical protein